MCLRTCRVYDLLNILIPMLLQNAREPKTLYLGDVLKSYAGPTSYAFNKGILGSLQT